MKVASNNVVFAALRDRLRSDLDAVVDVVLDGDDHTAAVVARGELPGLVAGLHALLAQHVPNANGQCRACRAGRWWRRTPVPCRTLLEFQLARGDARTDQPRHPLSTTRSRTDTATRFPRCRDPHSGPPDTVSTT